MSFQHAYFFNGTKYMDIKPCNINLEECDNTVMGGGILPFCMINGEILILLAQERQVMHWRGSQKWSGFEGGRKNEEDIFTTASREFQEESLAICNIVSNTKDFPTVCEISDLLKEKDYEMRITLRVADDDKHREHVTFLKRIEYDKYMYIRFTCIRDQLITLFHMIDNMNSITISEGFPDFGGKYNNINISVIDRVSNIDSKMVVVCKDENSVQHEFKMAVCYTYMSRITSKIRIIKAIKIYMDLHPDILHHPSISNSRHIHDMKINADFLEKQVIRFWSVRELREVISNGGFKGEDVFRAYFIPVLQTILDNIDELCET